MIDHLYIFHSSGAVLLEHHEVAWKEDEASLMTEFVQQLLTNGACKPWVVRSYTFTYRMQPAYAIVLLLVHQTSFGLTYIDALADEALAAFCANYEFVLRRGLDAMLDATFELPIRDLLLQHVGRKPKSAPPQVQSKKKQKATKKALETPVKSQSKIVLPTMAIDDWAASCAAQKSASSSFWDSVQQWASAAVTTTLTRTTLAPIAAQLTQALVRRNVASEVADEIGEAVLGALDGAVVSSFTSVRTRVREVMAAQLTRILTPRRPTDLLVAARAKVNKPFTMLLCGVNGVGKSTTLAKVAAYLSQQGLRVGFAACDTFRSGAIEQLRVHAAALDLPLYASGYGREPATVARAAIASAAADGLDVLLIDTAGRMQDNAPLMAALTRLVDENAPDVVLFVGEALVGHEAVDQVRKFARAVRIDGLILTKFDTIDDNVGAAISMAHATRCPVYFVGVGQHYVDLKALPIDATVDALLS